MPKHSKDNIKPLSSSNAEIESKRRSALEQFFDLTKKAIKHISDSLEALQVCYACADVDGKHIPGKAKNIHGMCAICDGTYLIPDVKRRDWATEQIADRVAPKPKSVEMQVDSGVKVKELEESLKVKTEQEIDIQLKALGVKVDND